MAKLNKVQIENYMKLSHVTVDMDGKSVIVKGKNEIGKSSFINAIWVVLTGNDVPSEPIQTGKDSAEIRVEVKREDGTTILVKRKFKRDGKDVLTVSTLDGKTKYSSPQSFLNALIGEISFNPFEFMDKQPREQKKYLQQILGIDTAELEVTKKNILADKKSLEDKLITDQSKLDAIPMIAPDVKYRDPAEAIEMERGIQKQEDEKKRLEKVVSDHDINIQKKLDDADRSETQSKVNEDKIAKLQKEIDSLNEQNKYLAEESRELHLSAVKIRDARELAITAVAEHKVDERSSVETLLKEIKDNNELFAQKKNKEELEKSIYSTREEIETVKKSLKEIEDDRVKLIASTKMPIQGLDFSDDGIMFQGLPFTKDQFSTARMNMIGFEIAVALNPKLRILRVKDWLLLDSETQAHLTKLATENDYQLFCEVVSNDKEIGFEIISQTK